MRVRAVLRAAAALAVGVVAWIVLSRLGGPPPSEEESRAAERRAAASWLLQTLTNRESIDTSFQVVWFDAPVDVHARRVGEQGVAIAVDLYVKTLAHYFTTPPIGVNETRPWGPRATIALLDRDGDGVVDAFRQPAPSGPELTSPTTRFESVDVAAHKLQSLWDQVSFYTRRQLERPR